MDKHLRILHLEDEPDYSSFVKMTLEQEGLPVELVLVDNSVSSTEYLSRGALNGAEFPAIRLAGNSGNFSFIDFTEIFYGFTRLYQALPGLMSEGRLQRLSGLNGYTVARQNELIGVVVN